MTALPEELRLALGEALQGFSPSQLAQSVAGLIERYRSGHVPDAPILTSDLDVAAYAAYRMPATFAAVRAAMEALARAVPTFGPQTQLDLGGGTGAAAWAASGLWPSLTGLTVVEREKKVIGFGRMLADRALSPGMRAASWTEADASTFKLPVRADLVTISYLLGELPASARDRIVTHWAGNADTLLIVEPGTPPGYQRILRARELLLGLGLSIAAPCPHQSACPMMPGRDWCHFAARVSRTALHRQVKGAALGFEDEKFSYLAAVRGTPLRAPNRVLRHPQKRKGLVSLRLCTGSAELADIAISQRHGKIYREARDAAWGDAWPKD